MTTLNYTAICNSYLYERTLLFEACIAHLSDPKMAEAVRKAVFWENGYVEAANEIRGIFSKEPDLNGVLEFSLPPERPQIERCGRWLRLQVTTSYVLDLSLYDHDYEIYYHALSPKTHKKVRYLRNALPKRQTRVVPLNTAHGFNLFEELYAAQFPKYPMGSPRNKALREAYRYLHEQGCNWSHLLLDENNTAIAACLAYKHGDSVFYTHLTRRAGAFDKLSPGFYLTHWLIAQLFSEGVNRFFMGPGTYDYKKALLGQPLPVYRYVHRSLWNLPAILRLHHRLRKELRQTN